MNRGGFSHGCDTSTDGNEFMSLEAVGNFGTSIHGTWACALC